MQQQTDPTLDRPASSALRARPRWFFASVAAILLVIVAVGFAPSFYLPGVLRPQRAGSARVEIPTYIILHGIALTTWYALSLIQALLIAARRTRVHRTLGIFGAFLAGAVVVLSAQVVLRAVPRTVAAGMPTSGMALEVVGDLAILPFFAVLVALAIRHRNQPEVHKRLMTIASISIVAPAIVRWPGAAAAAPLSIIVPQLSLFGALMIYDVVTTGRIHKATALAVGACIALLSVVVPVASSELGQRIVDALK